MKFENSIYNVDCLFLLERFPAESVDTVYLDPPWLPKSTFDYLDVKEIDQYLFFLANRIQHIYRILRTTGNIFFHTTPEISPMIRMLLNHFLGEENYLSQYILPTSWKARFNSEIPRDDYEVILFYGKSKNAKYQPIYRPYTGGEIDKRFPYIDERGRYRLISLINPYKKLERPDLIFEWKDITPPKGRSWRYSREKLEKLYNDNLISFDLSNKLPSMKQYLDKEKGALKGNIWDDLAKPLTSRERTGFEHQQSVDLLKRIISIGSDMNDLILDPFCGSGTTLIAAQTLKRKWIGCDISKAVYDISVSRMIETIGKENVVFHRGYLEDVEKEYPTIYELDEPNIILTFKITNDVGKKEPDFLREDSIKPLIFTEGKTDWKHLKSAVIKLKESGYLDEGFNIEFFEEEIDMGDTELLIMCKQFAKMKQQRKQIFIFDRDNDKVLKEVTVQDKLYKAWGNNVYSFAIPIPTHRTGNPRISIELYYLDKDLTRTDANGRRLFLSCEFHQSSGRHITQDFNCMDINRLKGDLKIIDDKVFNRNNRKVALSKNDFADHIINNERNFRDIDINEFVKIFELIEQIMQEWDK